MGISCAFGRTARQCLAAMAVIVCGAAGSLSAQTPAATTAPTKGSDEGTPAWQPANLSPVFPDGSFPDYPPSPSAAANAAAATTVNPPALLPAPRTDYGPGRGQPREVQDAPGVPEFYRPPASTLPPYYYEPSYYNASGLGARPLADYAPPGFIEREWQDAPGAPEYTPITTPLPVSADEREKFVTRGMFPGSYMVPGTNTSFRFRGFVRFTGLYDLNPIGSRDDFVTNTIPVPQQHGQNANASARYSRIGLDTWTPTTLFSNWNLHTFIEADFFNGPAQAVGGGGNPFRLRFAFIDLGYFRVGQQNTVFMDSSAFPSTVDFAGPRGLVNQRRPGARITVPLTDNLFWAGGIELPFSDITTNGLGTGVQDIPDFASHLRYEADTGHLQLSSLVRSIGYQPTGGDVVRKAGWGLSASSNFHPWAILMGINPLHSDNPTGLERSRVLMQYTFGWGIGRYIQDTAGLGLDGQVDPANGGFGTLFATGWSVSYEHWFTEKWLSNLTYSQDNVGNVPGQPASTYAGAKYLAASIWFIPIRNLSLGMEYLWGERENIDGEKAHSNRLNALCQYNF